MKKSICLILLLLAASLVSADPSTEISNAAVNSTASDEQQQQSEESSGAGSSEEQETTLEPTTDETPPPEDEPETCLGKCPEQDGQYAAFLANERCDRFCQCVRGEPVVIECPNGLHFNVKYSVCDWPQSANCTGEGGVLEPVNSLLPEELSGSGGSF